MLKTESDECLTINVAILYNYVVSNNAIVQPTLLCLVFCYYNQSVAPSVAPQREAIDGASPHCGELYNALYNYSQNLVSFNDVCAFNDNVTITAEMNTYSTLLEHLKCLLRVLGPDTNDWTPVSTTASYPT